MKEEITHLYSKAAQKLQLPYDEYLALKEKADEAACLRELKSTVVADLQAFLGQTQTAITTAEPKAVPAKPEEQNTESVIEETEAKAVQEEIREENVESKKVSVEFSAEAEEHRPSDDSFKVNRTAAATSDLPPLKEPIARNFNETDASGRLFNVFTQYYTCLNDVCGGTARVTMKDRVCSFWNYDAWEEFAFVDIFENQLRIMVDADYTEKLKALQLCEVPRLLAARKNLVGVKVDDLNQTVLNVLAKAFKKVDSKVG